MGRESCGLRRGGGDKRPVSQCCIVCIVQLQTIAAPAGPTVRPSHCPLLYTPPVCLGREGLAISLPSSQHFSGLCGVVKVWPSHCSVLNASQVCSCREGLGISLLGSKHFSGLFASRRFRHSTAQFPTLLKSVRVVKVCASRCLVLNPSQVCSCREDLCISLPGSQHFSRLVWS